MWSRRIILLILILGWISLPGYEAVLEPSSLYGWTAWKAVFRAIVITYALFLFILNAPRFRWAFSNSMKWLWLYGLWCCITIIFSGNKFYSSYRSLEMITIMLLAAILPHKIKDEKEVADFIKDLSLITTVVMASVLGVFLLFPDWGAKFAGFDAYTGESRLRLGGSFLRTDIIAGFALMVFLFHFHKLINSAGLRGLMENALVCSLSSLLLFLSYSRICIASAIFLSSLGIWKAKRKLIVKVLWTATAIGAGVYVRLLFEWLTRSSPAEELLALNSRIYIWKGLLSEFLNSGVIITGYGSFTNGSQGLDFFVPEMGRVMNQPHNGYLSVLLGTGILGLILVLLITRSWFELNRNLKADGNFSIGAINLAVLGSFLHTTFDYGIWGVPNPETLLFFSFYCLARRVYWCQKEKGIL